MSNIIARFTNWTGGALRRVLNYYRPATLRSRGLWWTSGLIIVTFAVAMFVLSVIWNYEPERIDVSAIASEDAGRPEGTLITGYTTTTTLIRVAETLLNKPGGYLSNDLFPPGSLMDNMPNWEFGVLTQVRDLARSLRNDMSRSQSQSVEDEALAKAEPLFNFDNSSWMFPASESEYRDGIAALRDYRTRLVRGGPRAARFFARADNLREWLAIVEKRLGSLSQRLSASVGQIRINIDLAGDAGATQARPQPSVMEVKTPWLEIDDVFYEARGATWALIQFLQAVEIDFADVLAKKNAVVSLKQIVRELEGTQNTVWSPMVLNGRGFGFVTNYSLIMASYISRANAAVIDMRRLLEQG